MKNTLTINELIDDFTKVITFKILRTIKKYYGSLNEFKIACQSTSNKELKRFETNFHIDSKILQSLTRTSDGKRHLDEVLSNLNPELLKYKHKFDCKYKTSGKKFSKLSTFYIPFKQLDKLFALIDIPDESPFSTTSNFYNKRQHKLIDKLIFKYNVKQRKPYTKSDKFVKSVKARKINKILESNIDEMTDEQLDVIVNDLIKNI